MSPPTWPRSGGVFSFHDPAPRRVFYFFFFFSDGQPNHWHISKTISLGHIVTTAVVAIAGVLYLASLESKIDATALEVSHQRQEIERVDRNQRAQSDWIGRKLEEMRVEQKQDMRTLESKIDKLIDRELGKR